MNGYASTPRGHGSYHGYTNGHMPDGFGGISPRAANNNMPPSFVFGSRKERIDWRRMASINVDYMTRNLDIGLLQEIISGIAYCDIEQEIEVQMVDPNFIKVFRLSQLIIQYLLHSQDYLAHTIKSQEEELQASKVQQETKQSEVAVIMEQLNKVKEESHKRKKLLKAQQNLIQVGANNYHKCIYCDKAFYQLGYLQGHMQRKHPEYSPRPGDGGLPHREMQAVQEVGEKLEQEMNELRERLKMTQSQLEEERGKLNEQLRRQQEQEKDKFDLERQEEMQRQQFEKWREEQSNIHKEEMDKMQRMFMKEMKEIQENYSASQAALEDVQSKLGKRSNLGTLVDEDEIAEQKKALKKQQDDMEKMREHYEEELSLLKSSIAQEKKSMEKKWKEKHKTQKQVFQQEAEKLKEQLSQMSAALKIEREGGSQVGLKYEKRIKDLVQKSSEAERRAKEKEKEVNDLKKQMKKNASKPPPSPSPLPMMQYDEEEEETSEEEILEDQEAIENQKKVALIQGMKKELGKILSKNMENRGVPQGVKGITSQSLETKLKLLKQERQAIAKKYGKFYDIREQKRREIEKMAKERKLGKGKSQSTNAITSSKNSIPKVEHKPLSSTFPRNQPKPKSILSKPKSQEETPSIPPRNRAIPKKAPPPVAPRSSTLDHPQIRPSGRTAVSVPRVSFENDEESEEDDEDDLSLEDEEEEETDEEDDASPPPPVRGRDQKPAVPSRNVPPQTKLNAQGQDIDDSDWDSEDISDLDEISPSKLNGNTSTPAQSTPKVLAPPKGSKVAELSKSIELQLQGRKGSKKPVGGLDVSGTGRTSPDRSIESPSPRIPTIPDARTNADDDDDSDSLAISSLDGSTSAPPKPSSSSSQPHPVPRHAGHPATQSMNSSNTYGTSMWGSSSNKATTLPGTSEQSGKGTNKSSLVSVTDFDDDEDLDLSDL